MPEGIDYGSQDGVNKGNEDDKKKSDKEMMKSNIIILKVFFSTGISGERVAK